VIFGNEKQIKIAFMKSRLNMGNAYYSSARNLSSSCFLSTDLEIKMYRTMVLPVVLYGCGTWSVTIWE
jgi:hypothetical protein